MSGERPAFVHYQSWAGHHKEPCIVVDETPKRYRIRVDKPVALPPGFTLLLPGNTKLVPKRAITLISPHSINGAEGVNIKTMEAIRLHTEKYPDVSVEVVTTLKPGYVSCISPVPHLFGAEIHCRAEDEAVVRALVRASRATEQKG